MSSDTIEGMVLIPAGSFEMGGDVYEEEQPVHPVHLDAFYMDVYEVTNSQFKAFVDANPLWQKDKIADRFHDGEYLSDWDGTDYPSGMANYPVVFVSWYAAMAYAAWAGKRLPTEAEWEYAARGGLDGKMYPWGDDAPFPSDWYAATMYAEWTSMRPYVPRGGFPPRPCPFPVNEPNPAVANYAMQHTPAGPTPVGSWAVNGYGLYDMAGNVWEWCLDLAIDHFYNQSHSRNPIAGGENIQELSENYATVAADRLRVLRGGSWSSRADYLRVAHRGGKLPAKTHNGSGFRCVRDVN